MLAGVTSERERAWDVLVEATPPGWYVGTPVYHVEPREWALYAFDTTERAHIGRRSREWTAIAPSEEVLLSEMARCPREIASGRAPR